MLNNSINITGQYKFFHCLSKLLKLPLYILFSDIELLYKIKTNYRMQIKLPINDINVEDITF